MRSNPLGSPFANRFFGIAFRRSPDGDDVTIDEGRRMLTAYFRT
ncbi:hypothetical protein AB0H51_02685 [Streptomyces griseoluteus]